MVTACQTRQNDKRMASWPIYLKFFLVIAKVKHDSSQLFLIYFEKYVHCKKNTEKMQLFLTVCKKTENS